MSEATYALKVVFRTREEAMEALPRVRELLLELAGAHDLWQERRSLALFPDPCRPVNPARDRAAFWAELRERYPGAYCYLASLGKAEGDHDDGLVGLLDFGERALVRRGLAVPADEPALVYRAEVWHGSDWAGLAGLLEAEYGALRATWLSEEAVDLATVLE